MHSTTFVRGVLATTLAIGLALGSTSAQSKTPIAEAAQARDAAAIKKLIKEGNDVNAAQGDGMTALHWAALNGDAEIAQMLLYAGANVSAKTRLGGYTPLHLASQIGNARRHRSPHRRRVAGGGPDGDGSHGVDARRRFGQRGFGPHAARERRQPERVGKSQRSDRAHVRSRVGPRRRRQAPARPRR